MCAAGMRPEEVLVGAVDALDWIRRMKGKRIQAEKLRIDWQECGYADFCKLFFPVLRMRYHRSPFTVHRKNQP
jgi:hypothetical protein